MQEIITRKHHKQSLRFHVAESLSVFGFIHLTDSGKKKKDTHSIERTL